MDDLLEVYYLPLFRFAVRLCGSPTKALQLTQRTFNLALDRSQDLPVPTNVRGWLFSILFHDYLENRSRQRHA
jgi:DNA-directed RNA polymerase specialized sigma24 family protein